MVMGQFLASNEYSKGDGMLFVGISLIFVASIFDALFFPLAYLLKEAHLDVVHCFFFFGKAHVTIN
jgi:hypothetical protein